MRQDVDPIELTKKLVSFNTINPPGFERDSARFLAELLEQHGFETGLYDFEDRRTSLVAHLDGKGKAPPICFSGHLDTVPLGSLPWKMDPFGGEIDGDRLYGRGASDMKGGVAAMVASAVRIARVPRGDAGIALVITAGEETGCQGAHYLASLEDVLGTAGALIIGEPTSNQPRIGNKATLWLEAMVAGMTAHGSTPERGVNAIYKAADVVTRLREYDFKITPHQYLGKVTINVGTIRGGQNFNSVPDSAVVGIDIRTIPGLSNREIIEKLQMELGEEVDLASVLDIEGVITDPQNPWVEEVFDLAETCLGMRPPVRALSGFTDASILVPAYKGPPALILGPGEMAMAHAVDEFCYISKIHEACELYLGIAKRWCGL